MEKQFFCSKKVLKKARIAFWFYTASVTVILALFLFPVFMNGSNAITWLSIIYIFILLLFGYQGYCKFRVLRALQNTYLRVYEDTVSGLSIRDPYQKGICFQIRKDEIISVEEKIVAAEKKSDVSYSHRLHRPPFDSTEIHGYQSTAVRTKNDTYTLFGIELTEEVREALTFE